MIVFKPGSSTEFLVGNDGGIYRTTDGGTTITSRVTGYNVTQYYACAIHPATTNYFLAGAQDNGTQKFSTAGINATSTASGGDGAFCHIDQTDGVTQITSYVYNNYFVSLTSGNTFIQRFFGNTVHLSTLLIMMIMPIYCTREIQQEVFSDGMMQVRVAQIPTM